MRRILVVDDDPQTRAAIGLWLRHCGFRVAITDGGASGLDVEPLTVMLIIIAIYLVLGCFMETLSLMIATTPIVVPITESRNFACAPSLMGDTPRRSWRPRCTRRWIGIDHAPRRTRRH